MPGMLQEARQGHGAGLAVRMLWNDRKDSSFDYSLVLHTENQGMNSPLPLKLSAVQDWRL